MKITVEQAVGEQAAARDKLHELYRTGSPDCVYSHQPRVELLGEIAMWRRRELEARRVRDSEPYP